MNFKEFLQETEQNKDVESMLQKLPKRHQNLVKSYKFKYIPTNTLKNDKTHVGEIDEKGKTITVAAPWNYGREFTTLHEIAHMIWDYLLTDDEKENWKKIFKKEKHKQGAEESFCMAYANTYASHKDVEHTHDTWEKFIKGIK